LEVNHKGRKQEIQVQGDTEQVNRFADFDLDGILLRIAYGSKTIRLPFSLHLENFLLDRYPGSMSPSSYESIVVLRDDRYNLNEKHRIFMNKVLDYKGYRFFQSSYDEDERGTILSVNHDFMGTWISYFGYFMLGAGFILTLLNRKSWFHSMRNKIRDIRIKRKGILLLLVLVFGVHGLSFTQNLPRKPVSRDHAEKFGQLNVQTYNGRFEPLHTLALDVMHKITRKDNFNPPRKGPMDFMQVFIDMMMDPEFWKQQRIIYIREKSVRDVLGIQGKYAAFNEFFNSKSEYKLSGFIEDAFRKKQAEQSKFDKEIIKVDERMNICLMIFEGSLLRIFPDRELSSHTWISAADTMAHIPLSGPVSIIGEELGIGVLSYNNLLQAYFRDLLVSLQSGDYSGPEKILNYMKAIQANSYSAELLPSDLKVRLEIYYNKAGIFEKLRNYYGMLSLVLLLLAFIDDLSVKKRRMVRYVLAGFIGILGLAFLYHTFGMGLRWYLSGHAPWSNGYEALLLIAWGGLLAGFLFMRNSKITLASTALLAFFILMTAGHSNYDPQLTNLQPVLKSYWLIIHVAAITISYGFLGSGFILGMINLFLSLFKTAGNAERITLTIEELTSINAINLTIGLFLATLGTFLGGIWANESWGRYWGWDAKETWALIIVIMYSVVLHLRLIPGMMSMFIFNAASVISFGSVIMTFVGVNYYLSKGLHSYAADETPVFPLWAWIIILAIIGLIIVAGIKDRSWKEGSESGSRG
jgi:cytochrome c-type biogenesis protein CcsB